ncbi:MAG: ImmA/IrrE family metallo-endopeptidase, partial [Ignavibacteria bacterium]|nr:ImmA/IrrE family metallo-endopeptidase [Ignavibacteria bacterium]
MQNQRQPKINYGINPEILAWARIKAGYSIKDIAGKLSKSEKEIERWEKGLSMPTYIQLEKLAYQIYKRPIALFFFPKPPLETDPKQSFRTLPDFEIENLTADTRFQIRQAQALQIALKELNDGANKAEFKIFKDIQLFPDDNITNSTEIVRDYLNVNLEEQIKWKDADTALKKWRTIIEKNGIYIFKSAFKQKDVSGFCLQDSNFPVIYVNNSTSHTRQIFTILHELAHLLLNLGGITKVDDSYINFLKDSDKRLEIFSNEFAAELLVPTKDFEKYFDFKNWEYDSVNYAARRYKVSREVILRKLLDRNLIGKREYNKKASEWTKEYLSAKKKLGGG